jgi:hypothetical protein
VEDEALPLSPEPFDDCADGWIYARGYDTTVQLMLQ